LQTTIHSRDVKEISQLLKLTKLF